MTLTVAATAGTNAADTDFRQTRHDADHRSGFDGEHRTVTVTAVDDVENSADKSVAVAATVSGVSGVANPADVTLTIADDGRCPVGDAGGVADAAINENGGTTTVTATLSYPSSAATTVRR